MQNKIEYSRYLGENDQSLFPMSSNDWEKESVIEYVLNQVGETTESRDDILKAYREGYESWSNSYQ